MELIDLQMCHRLLAPRLVVLLGTMTQDGRANMMPLTNVTSVSTEPQLVAIAIYHEWRSCDALLKAVGFTISVASLDQIELVWKLGGRYSGYSAVSTTPKGIEFGSFMDENFSQYGPVLKGAIAWLECTISQVVSTGGDHTLFIGEIVQGAGRSSTYTCQGDAIAQPAALMQWSGNRFCGPGNIVNMEYYS